MAVYTVLLAEGLYEDTPPFVVYTAPPEGVTVVRDVVLSKIDGGSSTRLILDVLSPGGLVTFLAVFINVPDFQTQHWEGRQVIPPGAKLRVRGSNDTIMYRITGYRLGL